MRTKKQIFKYYTPWQIARVKAKNELEINQKWVVVESFLKMDPRQENKERVLNWLYGLWIAYPSESTKWFEVGNLVMYLEDQIFPSNPDKEYPFTELDRPWLTLVFKDLYTRAKKWAKNHYYNKELLTYLQELADYLNRDITELIIQSNTDEHKSTHKFIY